MLLREYYSANSLMIAQGYLCYLLGRGSAAPTGLKNVYQYLTQGLRPGLCRSIALAGLIYVFTSNQLLVCFDGLALHKKTLTRLYGFKFRIFVKELKKDMQKYDIIIIGAGHAGCEAAAAAARLGSKTLLISQDMNKIAPRFYSYLD